MTHLSEQDLQTLQAIANGAGPRPKFNVAQVAQRIAAENPVAKAYGELHLYRDGVYRAGGRDIVRSELISMLGEDWRPNRADAVVTYLYDFAPALLETPPVNLINFKNGILDWKTGKLSEHSPGHLTAVQIPVEYDPGAECPDTLEFLGQVLEADAVEPWLEMVGYFLIPYNGLQMAFMGRGGGGNGKSTAISQIEALLGPANFSSIPLQRLEEDKFAAAQLGGKLLNTFSDLDARALQSSSIFKSVTGNDSIMCERKYGDAWSQRVFARLLFSANQPPATSDSSEAFFRRWLIFEFNRTFKGTKADRNLVARLTTPEELSGLATEGLKRLPGLLERGAFTVGKSSLEAAERFRTDTDTVAGFLAEACGFDFDHRVEKSKLFPAYRDWCLDANRRPLGKQNFNRRVQELHPELSEAVVHGTRFWSGMKLETEAIR